MSCQTRGGHLKGGNGIIQRHRHLHINDKKTLGPNYSLGPQMLAARNTPPSMCEFMLAGHSASSCNLPISVQDLALDVQALELPHSQNFKGLCSEKVFSCNDSSSLPAPRKFCKKLSDHDSCSVPYSSISSKETKRAFRQALGVTISKDEAAHWSSSTEARQLSASKVSKLFSTSSSDR